MGTWTLLVMQNESATRMKFSSVNEFSDFIRCYGKNFESDTRLVFMNSNGPEVEVSKKYHFTNEEVQLPDGF